MHRSPARQAPSSPLLPLRPQVASSDSAQFTGVHLEHRVHQRHPDHVVARLNGAGHGRRAAPAREQRRVDVEGAATGDGQEPLGKEVAVRHRDAQVGGQALQLVQKGRLGCLLWALQAVNIRLLSPPAASCKQSASDESDSRVRSPGCGRRGRPLPRPKPARTRAAPSCRGPWPGAAASQSRPPRTWTPGGRLRIILTGRGVGTKRRVAHSTALSGFLTHSGSAAHRHRAASRVSLRRRPASPGKRPCWAWTPGSGSGCGRSAHQERSVVMQT